MTTKITPEIKLLKLLYKRLLSGQSIKPESKWEKMIEQVLKDKREMNNEKM